MKATIEQVQIQLSNLKLDRQHGRKGKALDDSTAELKRLKNNLASRLCRARLKQAKELGLPDKRAEKSIPGGLTEVDIRRFKQCFVYESILPSITYVKRMTGLTDTQIEHACKYTKLKCAKV